MPVPEEPERRPRFTRPWIPLLAAAGLFAVAFASLRQDTVRADDGVPPVVSTREGNFELTYHVTSGSLSLYRVDVPRADVRDLAREHPDVAERLRRELCDQYDVEDLAELQEHYADEIEMLRSLGYL